MTVSLDINGTAFLYPETGDVAWGPDATDWAVAVTSGMLQKAGGLFQLLAETDFGSAYGLKSLYYKTRTTNPADAGQFRLARADVVSWRNEANDGNLDLSVNSSNVLLFNGVALGNFVSVSDTATIDLTLAAGVLSAAIVPDSITNSMINSAAAIAFSKLAALTSGNILVGSAGNVATSVAMSGDVVIDNAGVTAISPDVIVNADINSAAAIAYSKLALTGSIVNADVNAAAAIAYSKLALTGSIVNADVSASAAIAYSKLALTGAIVNADINASAAIVYSKLSLSNSISFSDLSSSTCTIDEDNMASNSAVRVPTQQSVKAYVDTSVAAAASVETVTTTPIAATTSIGTSSSSVRVCSSASAFDLTLDNTFAAGRNMTIENTGTNEVTLKANDATVICTLYRKCRIRLVALSVSPATNTDWMVITPIVSPPIDMTSSFGLTGFGTIAQSKITRTREGQYAVIEGFADFGTFSGATNSVDLPATEIIDTAVYTSQVNRQRLGIADHLRRTSGVTYSGNAAAIFYDGSTNNKVFFGYASGATVLQYSKAAGSGNWAGDTSGMSFNFRYAVSGWTSFTG